MALDAALDRLAAWLRAGDSRSADVPAIDPSEDRDVDRLFRQMVPDVTGRRSGVEILHRLRRKWELGHTLGDTLGRVRDQVHLLSELRGPVADVLNRLDGALTDAAPRSCASLTTLTAQLRVSGIDPDRVEIDLGLGRGIGFYSGMIFELLVDTEDGPIEVGGGGRYDGLTRVLGSDRDNRGVGFALGLERVADIHGRTRPGSASKTQEHQDANRRRTGA